MSAPAPTAATHPALRRAKQMFNDRRPLESLWETAYRYILPERAAAFAQNAPGQSEQLRIGNEVFDSEAIDSAERLAELLLNGLIPQGMRWFRVVPGPYIRDARLREQLAPLLELATQVGQTYFEDSNFFLEMQPMMLDRIVGGTGVLSWYPENGRGTFKTIPLSESALQEDYRGNVSAVARRYKLTARELLQAYGHKLDEPWRRTNERDLDARRHEVLSIEELSVTGEWETTTVLAEGERELSKTVSSYRRNYATRWAGVPGSPYGRGPGMRALSDVRLLNKLKELSVKNAALSTSGVYTVVDDGVINPYTVSLEPGARIPVASNSPNDPSILPLPTSADFNVAMFSLDDLRNSIKRVFMNDRFQPLGRTPLSALEVSERTRSLAESAGLATARLQAEVLTPLLQGIFIELGERGELPEGLDLTGHDLRVEYIGPLARAQWAEDEQNILTMATYAMEFGQVDAKAGLVVDAQRALRKLGEIKGVPSEILRTEAAVEELMQQSADAQVELEEDAGGMG